MINIHALTKYYDSLHVLDGITMEIAAGETLAIVGPSGAGKSTILRCVTGLDSQFSGSIRIKNEPSGKYLAKQRIALVPQKYANFPWLSVFQNVRVAFHDQDEHPDEQKAIIEKLLSDLELTSFGDYYIDQLSGGMQQRVAIARALAQNTEIIAFDEPFGALDARTRENIQIIFKKLSIKSGKTSLFITHDIEEAIFIADKVAVISKIPSTIIKIYISPYKKDLNVESKLSHEFIMLRKQIQSDID